MNFPCDHIAIVEAGALIGLPHRFPEDNYSPLDFNRADVVALSRAVASIELGRRSV